MIEVKIYRDEDLPEELRGKGMWWKHSVGNNKFEWIFSPFAGINLEKIQCKKCGDVYYKRDKGKKCLRYKNEL